MGKAWIKYCIKITSLLLALSFLVSLIAGCKSDRIKPSFESESVSCGWLPEDSRLQPGNTQGSGDSGNRPGFADIEAVVSPEVLMAASLDSWETYVGDIETFVYGLIISLLESKYSVFPGYVSLSDGYEVYGIAYTDYSECYSDDEETQVGFTAGFISFPGELYIPKVEFDSGLLIHNSDYESDDVSFILSYVSEPFKDHCVVYGKYLIYGIDESGTLFYSYSDYVHRTCDESIGTLYSYDEERVLFLAPEDVGKYVEISGSSISGQIDYAALKNEIDSIIEKQDFNFKSIDVISCAYISQQAVTSYLLSLQEETFLGFDVAHLIEIAKQLDPQECIRITDTGLGIVSIEPMPQKGADALTKWLVGTGCVIAVAVGTVASFVTVECPALSAATGAVTATAIEMFMQVVIDGTNLESISWARVAASATSGAVSGFLGPYIGAVTRGEGAGNFIVDSAIDGLIAGIETAVLAALEGKRGLQLVESFGTGFAIGFSMSAAFKLVGKIVSKISVKASGTAEKIAPKLTRKMSEIKKNLSKKFYNLKKKVDGSVFHSKYISENLTNRQLARIISNGDDTLYKKSLKALKKDGILDIDGKLISKEQLVDLFENVADGTKIAFFKVDDDTVDIIKQNGCLSITFSEDKYPSVLVKIDDSGRTTNFTNAAVEYKKMWIKDPDSMPAEIRQAIEKTGIALEDIEPAKLVSIIRDKNTGWVFHEEIDLKHVRLVPRSLHDKAEKTGVAHMGGFALIKHLKTHMGQVFFEQIVHNVSTWVSVHRALERGRS